MTNIIRKLKSAIRDNRDDVVEFIISQDNSDQQPINIARNGYILDYVSKCSNNNIVQNAVNTCLQIDKIAPFIVRHIMMTQCSIGNTDVVKMLLSVVDHHYDNELFFRTACKYGHIDTAKALFDKAEIPVDVSALNYDAFRQSCNNNHINLAKWLYNLCSETISLETMTDIYNDSKRKNNKKISEWLLSVHKQLPIRINPYDSVNIGRLIANNSSHKLAIPWAYEWVEPKKLEKVVPRITRSPRMKHVPENNYIFEYLHSMLTITLAIVLLCILCPFFTLTIVIITTIFAILDKRR
jgi:hypothetical protein